MATNRAKLTKSVVDKAIYQGKDGGRFIIWDTDITGLGLRVYPSGRKSFVLSYRHHNRKRLMVLGSYGAKTVQDARADAIKELAILGKDADPLRIKQQNAAGDTVAEFCAAYMDRHAKIRKKSWKDDQSMIDQRITPAFGSLQMKVITRDDIATLHRKIGREINDNSGNRKHYLANRVLSLLSKMFELAVDWGYVPENHSNPAKRIQKFPEVARDAWVKPGQLPKLAEAIDAEPNPVAQDAIWLYLLLGMRKTELLQLKWTDIDLERGEIRLSDTKAGRRHYLPLPDAARIKLESIVRLSGNPYVLPGKIEGNHLVNISKPWSRIRKDAGLHEIRLHDLRRTLGSWLAQSGNSLHLIGRVLNHSNTSTTQVYARFAQNTVKAALDKHGAEVMGHAGKKNRAPVATISGLKK